MGEEGKGGRGSFLDRILPHPIFSNELEHNKFLVLSFKEVGDLLVGHSSLGQFLSVWSQDGCVGVFLVDIQSRDNDVHGMA